ncbi:hypothetical protein DFP72DRAFT_1063457 [Ephemerocybe angulata]|uniref:Uncharacterized protein n=1 Tax=Ephemerocybe angulata TaxID=980116 RepID=A0A8H6I9F7_9AGAR|nr:hypothetical protein DFP72DRAFT_1063457 [Tulosesus angulatus]
MLLQISDATLRLTPEPCPPQAFERFLWNLRNSLNSLTNPTRTQLRIEHLRVPGRDLGIVLTPYTPGEPHGRPIIISDERVRAKEIDRPLFINDFLDVLTKEFDFSHLRSLHLPVGTEDSDLDVNRYRRLFGHLPQLTRITFFGRHMTLDAFHLLDPLGDNATTKNGGSHPSRNILFPSLVDIGFINVDLDCEYEDDEENDVVGLIEVLLSREAEGYPVKRLIFGNFIRDAFKSEESAKLLTDTFPTMVIEHCDPVQWHPSLDPFHFVDDISTTYKVVGQ